jgi:hypothetical protein
MRNDNRPKERDYSNYQEGFPCSILDSNPFVRVFCRREFVDFPFEYSFEPDLVRILHLFTCIHFIYYTWISGLDGTLDFFGMVTWLQQYWHPTRALG